MKAQWEEAKGVESEGKGKRVKVEGNGKQEN